MMSVLCELQVFSLVIEGVGRGGGEGGVIRLSSRLMFVVPLSFFPLLVHSSSFPFSSPLTDPPVITSKTPPDNCDIKLTYGGSETITVKYDKGYPPAKVEWSQDGHPINIPDPRITTANGETTLTLTNNDPSVRGTYGVKISNGVGNDATAVWTVKAECKLLYKVD